jgi:hypothetical protein
MAVRVVPSVQLERFDATREILSKVSQAKKVAGGTFVCRSVDLTAAACNIQSANLTQAPSNKDPLQPRTLVVFGLLASPLQQRGRVLQLDYSPLVKTAEQATAIYDSYLDELKVTGLDVYRFQVRKEHIPQGAGQGVSGHHWAMEVSAPQGKLKLLCTTGQSEALANYPIYDPNQGTVGMGALGLRFELPVQEVRTQYKYSIDADVLWLDYSRYPADVMQHGAGALSVPVADDCRLCHRAWLPACDWQVWTPLSAAARCPAPQLWRWTRMNEIDWQYLACSCIAYDHHMSWARASQLCAAGAAHEPP